MVRVEEIKEAIAKLSVDELDKHLSETVWDGISEGSPQEDALHNIIDEAMEPFIMGYSNEETRPYYLKLMELIERERLASCANEQVGI